MFAAVYAALGDQESAFDWLERAYAARENEIEMMGAMPNSTRCAVIPALPAC